MPLLTAACYGKQLKHEDPLDALILDFLDAKKGTGK